MDPFKVGCLPLPYLDVDKLEANWTEIRRLKAAGHIVYLRKLGDRYEIVDGGPVQTT